MTTSTLICLMVEQFFKILFILLQFLLAVYYLNNVTELKKEICRFSFLNCIHCASLVSQPKIRTNRFFLYRLGLKVWLKSNPEKSECLVTILIYLTNNVYLNNMKMYSQFIFVICLHQWQIYNYNCGHLNYFYTQFFQFCIGPVSVLHLLH